MRLNATLSKIRRVLFLLRKKGIQYTLNYIHFNLFFATKNPLFLKFLYWFAPYPSYLEVEVTTRCNLKCLMCEHTYWQEPSRDMSFKQFKRIIDQFPGLKWIGLTGIGESFLNKDFMKMVGYVKDKNIFVELFDTFYFIDEKTAKELIEMGVDKMFISLDAATKETYEKIRVGSNFERVLGNLKRFFEIKQETKAYFPQIAFHYIVNTLNLKEIPQYIELVHSLAPQEKVTVQLTRMLHQYKEVENLFVEIPGETMRLAEEKAKQFGIKLVWNADVAEAKPPVQKCSEWTMPFIFVTGHVIPCCAGNEAGNRDFQKKTALGNIFEQDFKEIWRGPRYRALRKMLGSGQIPPPCRNCSLYESHSQK